MRIAVETLIAALIAALIATIFLVIVYGVPDESGIVALTVIPLAILVIFGSAMTYSRIRGAGDAPGADRFLGGLAATFVLFVAGAAGALALDATSTIIWVPVALAVVAPLVVIPLIDSRSRRTTGQ